MRFLATIVSAALLTACATIAGAPPARLAADPFYRKHVDAAGIPILSSARVPDAALFAARMFSAPLVASVILFCFPRPFRALVCVSHVVFFVSLFA